MSTQGHRPPASIPYTSFALFAEKEEFPLTNDSPPIPRSRIRDWSLLRALERAALVSVRLLLGEPSNLVEGVLVKPPVGLEKDAGGS